MSGPNNGVSEIISVLERLRGATLLTEVRPGMTQSEQTAALQMSTAMHLLHAGANMLLMSSALGPAPPSPPPPAAAPEPEWGRPSACGGLSGRPGGTESPAQPKRLPHTPQKPIASAAIALPTTFTVPPEKANLAIRTVTLGGSGSRTSAVTIGGAEALPFRHFEGHTGRPPVIAMEVFDQPLKSYPESLRSRLRRPLERPRRHGPLLRG